MCSSNILSQLKPCTITPTEQSTKYTWHYICNAAGVSASWPLLLLLLLLQHMPHPFRLFLLLPPLPPRPLLDAAAATDWLPSCSAVAISSSSAGNNSNMTAWRTGGWARIYSKLLLQ
jgi:uncharacterized protein (TIGR03382 family)